MRKSNLIATSLILLALPASAQDLKPIDAAALAPCVLDIETRAEVSWRGLHGRGYEASTPTISEPAQVMVRHSGAACSWFVVVSGVENGLAGPGDTLSYQTLDQPTGRDISSRDLLGGTGQRISGIFRDGDDIAQAPIFVSIPSGQSVRGGFYTGQATLLLYRDGVSPELIRQVPLSVSARVPPVLSVSSPSFSSGNSASIDLGRIDDGASALIDFSISSNVGVSVRVESTSGGILQHQSGALGVPYTALLGGRSFDLSLGSAVVGFPVSSAGRFDLPLSIDVAPGTATLAGRYSDTLTVTFTAD